MKFLLWSTYDFDDEEWMFDEIPVCFTCPFCQQQQVGTCTPEDSYGDFYITCKCGFMGIYSYEMIEAHDPPEVSDFQANYCYLVELAEFTHYNKMDDYDVESEQFKLLEKQWLNGNTVWEEFQPHRFYLDPDECYNRTFRITGSSGIEGEFHFGFD